jgi:glycosyltransferase involved in cell wall biosynthesis
MEAMAQGRPVISTYVAGLPELVRPGETGWLVPAGNEDDLAAAMRASLATSPAGRARMGKQALERVRARHSIETEVGKLRLYFAGEDQA